MTASVAGRRKAREAVRRETEGMAEERETKDCRDHFGLRNKRRGPKIIAGRRAESKKSESEKQPRWCKRLMRLRRYCLV